MASISGVEVKDVLKVERVGVHSHIRGLGLSHNLEPSPVGDGMVGQVPARRAAGLIVKMIQVRYLKFSRSDLFIRYCCSLGRQNCWSCCTNSWECRNWQNGSGDGYIKSRCL